MTNIQNACVLLIHELYKTEPVGGEIHIVTDDFNVHDEDLCWCEHYIKRQKKEHKPIGKLELAILWLLAMMTEEEREECVVNACKVGY